MQKYPRETVAEVLAANDIVDIIGAALDLKPAGSGRFKALCPFHHEKTPSFTVNRPRQIFHCFGCGKGGDAIAFLAEFEGLSFSEALRKLADRAAIRLPALSEQTDGTEYLRTKLFEFGKFAVRFYQELLAHPLRGSVARQYLKTRALSDATLARFGLGFAPDDWSALRDAARQQGFKEELLRASGLCKAGERGGSYDFFRNRIIIPIRDVSGNIVAFGGRDLGNSPAKYINSPETPVYKKSRVLYGLHESREGLRRSKYAILVEGYFDALRCFDAGIDNVVATCGTALTGEQASLIRRYVAEVVVVYDGDAAGIQAALKGTGLLMRAGLGVKALVLPDGNDPDDYIKAHGREAFLALVAQADHFMPFYLRNNAARMKSIEGRTEVIHEVYDLIALFEDRAAQETLIKDIASSLDLQYWNLWRDFERWMAARHNANIPARTAQIAPEEAPIQQDDCDFLAGLLNHPALFALAQEKLGALALPPGPLAEILRELFERPAGSVLQGLENPSARRLYAAAVNTEPVNQDLSDLTEKRINRLEKEMLAVQAEQVMAAIKDAERMRDSKKTMELLILHTELQHRIKQVGAA